MWIGWGNVAAAEAQNRNWGWTWSYSFATMLDWAAAERRLRLYLSSVLAICVLLSRVPCSQLPVPCCSYHTTYVLVGVPGSGFWALGCGLWALGSRFWVLLLMRFSSRLHPLALPLFHMFSMLLSVVADSRLERSSLAVPIFAYFSQDLPQQIHSRQTLHTHTHQRTPAHKHTNTSMRGCFLVSFLLKTGNSPQQQKQQSSAANFCNMLFLQLVLDSFQLS